MNYLRWLLVVIMAALVVDNALDGDWSRAAAFAALGVANFALASGQIDRQRGMRTVAYVSIAIALVLLVLRWIGGD